MNNNISRGINSRLFSKIHREYRVEITMFGLKNLRIKRKENMEEKYCFFGCKQKWMEMKNGRKYMENQENHHILGKKMKENHEVLGRKMKKNQMSVFFIITIAHHLHSFIIYFGIIILNYKINFKFIYSYILFFYQYFIFPH